MIRPSEPRDTPAVLDLARGTRVFREVEIEALRELLDDFHEGHRVYGDVSITFEHEGQVAGLSYYAPDTMTDRTWYLYWIIVASALHGHGIGTALLRHTEAQIRALDGRLLLIETSTLPSYDPTRRFYLKHGYALTATIPDYYADGDSLALFSKRFLPRDESS